MLSTYLHLLWSLLPLRIYIELPDELPSHHPSMLTHVPDATAPWPDTAVVMACIMA